MKAKLYNVGLRAANRDGVAQVTSLIKYYSTRGGVALQSFRTLVAGVLALYSNKEYPE